MSGRSISIKSSDEPYTDTDTLWLPPVIHKYASKQQNFTLYKAIAAHLWAQIRYGTFRRVSPNAELLSERLDRYPNPVRARQLFGSLETFRLDACIVRDLPGLAREMRALYPNDTATQLTSAWKTAIDEVQRFGSSVADTLIQLDRVYADSGLAPTRPWQGALRPEQVEATMSARTERERQELQSLLNEFVKKLQCRDQAVKSKKIPLNIFQK